MLKKYALKMGVKPCPFCGGKNIASVIEAWNKYCEETER